MPRGGVRGAVAEGEVAAPAPALRARPPTPHPRPRPPPGFYKAGGSATASQQRVLEVVEAARMRGKEVRALLRQALEAADAAAAVAGAG